MKNGKENIIFRVLVILLIFIIIITSAVQFKKYKDNKKFNNYNDKVEYLNNEHIALLPNLNNDKPVY